MRKRYFKYLMTMCFAFLCIIGPTPSVYAQEVSDEIVFSQPESVGEYQITLEGISHGRVVERHTTSFTNQTLHQTSEQYFSILDLLSPYYTSIIAVLLATVATALSVVNGILSVFRNRKKEK